MSSKNTYYEKKNLKEHLNILIRAQSLITTSMVIVVVVKLYARIDIFRQVKKKHGHDVLNLVRKYEPLLAKIMKLQADIKFIKTLKKENLVPTFPNVKLATKGGNK